jgi:hypothetical protein
MRLSSFLAVSFHFHNVFFVALFCFVVCVDRSFLYKVMFSVLVIFRARTWCFLCVKLSTYIYMGPLATPKLITRKPLLLEYLSIGRIISLHVHLFFACLLVCDVSF